jgi:chromosome segregation ATPase
MSNKPITYEEKMKDRDNEFLYNKCVEQYHCIINYQSQMCEYKHRIKELEEKNKTFEDYNKDLNRKIDKLEEDLDAEKSISSNLARRIVKAIEYINENKEGTDCCGEIYIDLGEIEIVELLKILKGE